MTTRLRLFSVFSLFVLGGAVVCAAMLFGIDKIVLASTKTTYDLSNPLIYSAFLMMGLFFGGIMWAISTEAKPVPPLSGILSKLGKISFLLWWLAVSIVFDAVISSEPHPYFSWGNTCASIGIGLLFSGVGWSLLSTRADRFTRKVLAGKRVVLATRLQKVTVIASRQNENVPRALFGTLYSLVGKMISRDGYWDYHAHQYADGVISTYEDMIKISNFEDDELDVQAPPICNDIADAILVLSRAKNEDYSLMEIAAQKIEKLESKLGTV